MKEFYFKKNLDEPFIEKLVNSKGFEFSLPHLLFY